jgi:hypothetical protein
MFSLLVLTAIHYRSFVVARQGFSMWRVTG